DKIDIVVSDSSDNTVSIFKNLSKHGNISFASRISFPTAQGPFGVGIADVDGDGTNDIITANNGAGGFATLSVLRNVTTQGIITNTSFATHVDFTGGSSAESLAIADI